LSNNTAPESEERTWAGYYKDFESLPRIHEYLNNMAEFMAKCREHFPGEKILEIGTGTGVTAVYFSQSGYSVTGVDRDPGVIAINEKMNTMFGGTARFMLGDMFKLPFAPDSFDGCYHQGLMEHFDEPQIVEALKMQTTVCRRVVFAIPTLSWRGGVFGDERLWTGRRWLELLSPFRVVDVFGMAYSGLPRRGLNMFGRRISKYKPSWLYRNLALNSAGEIGFAIERR
jgi:SAM-dependent methyltransferase